MMFLLYVFLYLFMAGVVGTLVDRFGDPPPDAIGIVILAAVFWPVTVLLASGIGLGMLLVIKVCDFFEKKKPAETSTTDSKEAT